MSFRIWKSLWLPALVLLGRGLAIPAQEAVPQSSQPIQFSEPKRDTVSSNLNLIATKQVPLRNLENDLKKPFELFGAANSLSGAPLLPQRQPPSPMLNSKRIRELLERREDWLFETPQEREDGLAADDWFKVSAAEPTGENGRQKSSLERYYDRIERSRAPGTNQFKSSDPFNLQKERELGEAMALQNTGNPLGAENQAMQQLLRLAVKPNNRSLFENDAPRPAAEPTFGLGKVESSTQQLEAQESRREKFKTLLEPHAVAAPGISAALKPFGDQPGAGYATPNSPLATASTELSTTLGFVGKPAGPQELPRVAPALPSLTPTPASEQPPKIEKPRPVPTFNLPRRPF